LTIWAFVGIPTTFIAGYLADRLPVRVMLMVVSLGLASGLFVLTQVESYSAGVFFAVIHGSFFAVLLFLQNLAFANYYGRGHFGAIRGFITPFQTTANALGPLLATFIFDIQGDYNLALSLFIGIMLTVAGSFLFAPPPHHHEALKTESKPEPNPPFDERAGHLGPRIELP
jgi:MFS family permease